MQRLKITNGGQVSVPAAVRKRWGTNTVMAEDHGDHLVLRPVPDDPVAAAQGVFAHLLDRPLDAIMAEYRAEERAAGARTFGGRAS